MRDYEDVDTIEENVVIENCPDEEEGHFDEETKQIDAPEYPELAGRDFPKRILASSSVKILRLFGKHLKSSLDGTFKSAPMHWGQSFIWMVKYYGQWVPAIHAWLPDKTEENYKVKIAAKCVHTLS